jgi:hypothetical protein
MRRASVVNRDGTAGAPADDVHADIGRLGLDQHVMELEDVGYTIVPPDKAAPAGFVDRLLDAVLRIAEDRTGRHLDVESGTIPPDMPRGTEKGTSMFHWPLFEDRVFEEALMSPVSLSLATYLLRTGNEPFRPQAAQLQGVGKNVILTDCTIILKGAGGDPLHLHCDNGMMPGPFPAFAQVCNTTWLLTDYSKDNGALCFVPGSHRWCRHPTAAERFAHDVAVPVEAPRGSLVVWGGNMWHAAFPRVNPGLRATLVFAYAREYLAATINPADVPQEIIDRNPPRFAELMGKLCYARPKPQFKRSEPVG